MTSHEIGILPAILMVVTILGMVAFVIVVSSRAIDPAQHTVRAERERAQERSRRLLLDHLNAAQRAEYERRASFTLAGASGNTYTLSPESTVAKIGKSTHWLCVIPRTGEWIPSADVVLARKLMIEADESTFLAMARRRTE